MTTLLDAAPGACTVTGLDLSAPLVRRLAELGVRAGSVVEVLRRTSGGGVVVGVGGSRLALDAGTARAVAVAVGVQDATEADA